jgi:hypothetical protein
MVVGKRLGVLLEEFDPSGGLDLAQATHDEHRSVMRGDVVSFGIYAGLCVTVELDPQVQPFLFDHQIDGTPVLPGVMGVEGFVAAALSGFPGHSLASVEDVNFLAPFKFYRSEPRVLTIEVRYTTDGADVVAECVLIGVRTLANQAEPQRTVHFTGRVRLSTEKSKLSGSKPPQTAGPAVASADVYSIYFHGPAYHVVDSVGKSGHKVVAVLADSLPSNHLPENRQLVTTPRLTELAFQAAGIWEIGTTGKMALPLHIDRLVYAGDPKKAKGRLHAVVDPNDGGGFDALIVDEGGTAYVAMSGYRTVQLPVPVDSSASAPLVEAMTKEG